MTQGRLVNWALWVLKIQHSTFQEHEALDRLSPANAAWVAAWQQLRWVASLLWVVGS